MNRKRLFELAGNSSDTVSGNSIDIILYEYAMLREEAHARLGFYFHIFQVYMILVAGVITYVLQTATFDIILVFPIVSYPMLNRLLWDQKMVIMIDSYIRDVLSRKLNSIVGDQLESEQDIGYGWLGWVNYFPDKIAAIPKGYKHSASVLFLWMPFGASFLYSLYNAMALFIGTIPYVSKVPNEFGLMVFLFNVLVIVPLFLIEIMKIYGQKF